MDNSSQPPEGLPRMRILFAQLRRHLLEFFLCCNPSLGKPIIVNPLTVYVKIFGGCFNTEL